MRHSTPVPRRRRELSTILLAFTLFGFFVSPVAAQGPADLQWVPADAAGFIRILPLEIWNSEGTKGLRSLFGPAPEAIEAFERVTGLNPTTVESVTLILPTGDLFRSPATDHADSPVLAVALTKPFDRNRIVKALAPQGKEKRQLEVTYYVSDNGRSCLCLADSRTFLVGSEKAIEWLLKRTARKPIDGPLSAALQLAKGKSHVVAGFSVAALHEEMRHLFSSPQSLQAFLTARSMTASLNFGKELEVGIRLTFANENDALEGEKAAKGAVELGRQQLEELIQHLKAPLANVNTSVEEVIRQGVALSLMRGFQDVLKRVPIERDGVVVRTSTTLDLGYAQMLLIGGLGVVGTRAQTTFDRVESPVPVKPEKPRR